MPATPPCKQTPKAGESQSQPLPTCESHQQPLSAVCSEDECTQKFLCQWCLFQHPHLSSAFPIVNLSQPTFLKELVYGSRVDPNAESLKASESIDTWAEEATALIREWAEDLKNRMKELTAESFLAVELKGMEDDRQDWCEDRNLEGLQSLAARVKKFADKQIVMKNGEAIREETYRLRQTTQTWLGEINLAFTRICEKVNLETSNSEALPNALTPTGPGMSVARRLLNLKRRKWEISQIPSRLQPKSNRLDLNVIEIMKRLESSKTLNAGWDYNRLQAEGSIHMPSIDHTRTSNYVSPARGKHWNFGLPSHSNFNRESLPGTVYWEPEQYANLSRDNSVFESGSVSRPRRMQTEPLDQQNHVMAGRRIISQGSRPGFHVMSGMAASDRNLRNCISLRKYSAQKGRPEVRKKEIEGERLDFKRGMMGKQKQYQDFYKTQQTPKYTE